MTESKRIFGLDAMRALAIGLVVLAHLSIFFSSENARTHFYYLSIIGVELFFVLSGFLIGQILINIYLKKENYNLKTIFGFWIRRWFRTLPNYYLTLFIAVMGYSIFYFQRFILTELTYLSYFVFLQNMFTPQPSFFGATWSLAIEEWFYLLFPLIILIITQFKKDNDKNNILIAIIVYWVLALAMRTVFIMSYSFYSWDQSYHTMVSLRIDAVIFGVLGAWINKNNQFNFKKNKTINLIIGILLIIIVTIYFYNYVLLPDKIGVIGKLFFFNIMDLGILYLLPSILTMPDYSNTKLGKIIIWISLTSYSIYLTNELIVLTVKRIDGANIGLIISLILIIVSAEIQYKWFEKPMMNLRDKFR